MFDLEELEYFAAFRRLGTLSRVAEAYHISNPSVTRSMQHIEAEFGVPLFSRSKNRIELNDTGKKAADYAERILHDLKEAQLAVREYDRRLHMIVLESCAPMPMWQLQRELEQRHPGCVIASSIQPVEKLITDFETGACDLAIFPSPVSLSHGQLKPYLEENLMVSVPQSHPLAGLKEISFSALNGRSFMMRTEVGFWENLCRSHMPDSRFLMQQEAEDLMELEQHSDLLSFVTNLTERSHPANRQILPISDADAHVTFYIGGNVRI